MKSKFTLLFMCAFFLMAHSITAQVVSKDSVNSLKNEKEVLKLAKKVNENKLILAAKENEVAGLNSDIDRTAAEAESASAKNQEAANNLATDSQDKGKAKEAKKAANNAEDKASDARKAKKKLDDLYKNIEDLRKKIEDDERKIEEMKNTASLK